MGHRFCQDSKPPSLDDPGLAERIASRPLPKGGLFVVGPIGSHKTHLLAARTVDAARRGWTVKLLKWAAFCLEVRDTYKPAGRESEADVLARYASLDYLAIDDLGIGRSDRDESEAALRLAYLLLDARYDRCLVTDISSNCTPEELAARFDERIARRVRELTTVYPMLLDERGEG